LIALWSTGTAPEGLVAFLQRTGIAPVDLVLVGIVVLGLALLGRRLRQHDSGMLAAHGVERDAAQWDELRAQIDELIAHRPSGDSGGDPANVMEAVQRAIHLIERQQEKITNLSKATKMYGKPLLEITNQLAETSRGVAELGSRMDALKVIIEQTTARLDATVRTEVAKSAQAGTGDLRETIAATRDTVAGLEALQRDLSQRLTEKTDKMATEVAAAKSESNRGLEALRSALATNLEKVAAKVDAAAEQMAQQMAEQTAERLVAAVHTELESVGNSVAETKAAVARAAEQMTKAAAAAPAPSPRDPSVDQALERIERKLAALSLPPTRAAEASNAPTPPPAESKDDTEAKQAASKAPAAGGKSVQSAIEKLKKMRN
jgi:hypothetical protein